MKLFDLGMVLFLVLMHLTCISNASCFSDDSLSYVDKLPKNPKNIEFYWFNGGGMALKNEKIFISKDSCFKFINRNEHYQKIYFSFSEKELRDLYDIFITQKYDEIKVKNVRVYDRGGTSLSLKVDGEYFKVSNSGRSFIEKNYLQNYLKCQSAIHTITNAKANIQKIDVNIVLDGSLFKKNQVISVHFNDDKVVDKLKKNKSGIIHKTFLGESVIWIRIETYTKENKAIIIQNFTGAILVTKKENEIKIKLKRNKIYIDNGIPY